MRQAPVGMKCPDCSRQPLRARFGNPRSWVLGAVAGFGAAAAIGVVVGALHLRFIGILLPILAGFLAGAAVSKGAAGGAHPGFRLVAFTATAAGLTAGLALGGVPLGSLVQVGWLLSITIASLVAAFVSGRV